MREQLATSRAKLAWGNAHVETLKAHVAAWSQLDRRAPLAAEAKYDPDHHRFVCRITDVTAMPEVWGLYIGDALNNFRAALDHLAWHLAMTGTDPPTTNWQERQVQFPIYDDPKTYADMLPKRLPGISKGVREVVKRHQPFGPGETGTYLKLLADLNDFDKHRDLRPVVAQPINEGTTFEPINPQNFTPTGMQPLIEVLDEFKVGTELAYVFGEPTGDGEPKMGVKLSGSHGIFLAKGISFDVGLDGIALSVNTVLNEVAAVL